MLKVTKLWQMRFFSIIFYSIQDSPRNIQFWGINRGSFRGPLSTARPMLLKWWPWNSGLRTSNYVPGVSVACQERKDPHLFSSNGSRRLAWTGCLRREVADVSIGAAVFWCCLPTREASRDILNPNIFLINICVVYASLAV